MNTSFGAKLREIRRAKNISQRELAELVDLDFSYISKLENDRIPPPSADTIVAICKVLETSPEELLAVVGKIPSEVQEVISTSKSAQEFLRETLQMNLTDDDWETLKESLRGLRSDNE